MLYLSISVLINCPEIPHLERALTRCNSFSYLEDAQIDFVILINVDAFPTKPMLAGEHNNAHDSADQHLHCSAVKTCQAQEDDLDGHKIRKRHKVGLYHSFTPWPIYIYRVILSVKHSYGNRTIRNSDN